MSVCVAKLLEEAKPVEGWDNHYITPDGKLYKVREVKPSRHRGGYIVSRTMIAGKQLSEYLHRLVATTFLNNPDNLETVDHIDGDKTNNSVSNLQWLSHADNVRKHFEGEYVAISPGGQVIPFKNVREFCREQGLDDSHLCKVLNGKKKTTKGWRAFRKGEENERMYK